MIKLVYRYVLPLVILLVAALLGYNFFFGTDEEKEKSREILGQIKGLGSSVVGLLSSEKEKFDRGKYDDAMEKIGGAMQTVKEQAGKLKSGGEDFINKIKGLEAQKQDLQKKLDDLESKSGDTSEEAAELQSEIANLANQTEQLSVEMSED